MNATIPKNIPKPIPAGPSAFANAPFYIGIASILAMFLFSIAQVQLLNNGSSAQTELRNKFNFVSPMIITFVIVAIAALYWSSTIEKSAPLKYAPLMIVASFSFFFSVLAIVLSSVQVTLK